MSRTRISTTVDDSLMARARSLEAWPSVARMVDAALEALVHRYRQTEIDASYEAYDRIPMDEPDAWGSLTDFHEANRLHRGAGGPAGAQA